MNIQMYVSFWIRGFLEYMPRSGMLGPVVVLFLVLCGISILFSIVAVRGLCFLHISSEFVICNIFQFSSVQFSHSVVSKLCDPMNCSTQASPSITNSQSSPKPMSIELVMLSNHLILCHHLLLLPSIFPSIRVFSNESALRIRAVMYWWPKYWSFSFNISPSNEHLGLISFRMDWLDLLAAQGTLKSLL